MKFFVLIEFVYTCYLQSVDTMPEGGTAPTGMDGRGDSGRSEEGDGSGMARCGASMHRRSPRRYRFG